MGEFNLDTSGAVETPNSGGQVRRGWLWPDLSPFEQGYGGKMARALYHQLVADKIYPDEAHHIVAFRNWAPETLAAIRNDCAKFRPARFPEKLQAHYGACFWGDRQRGLEPGFPVLTATLSEDGRVRLS